MCIRIDILMFIARHCVDRRTDGEPSIASSAARTSPTGHKNQSFGTASSDVVSRGIASKVATVELVKCVKGDTHPAHTYFTHHNNNTTHKRGERNASSRDDLNEPSMKNSFPLMRTRDCEQTEYVLNARMCLSYGTRAQYSWLSHI